jgi:glutamyl-tRNA synthetase
MTVRTRFAPSPTGNVHIGNMRAAIYNWLYARHCGGKFLLRVEDTDRERSTQAAIDTLLEAMNWLGLDYDEEACYQSKQMDAHLEATQKLIDKGLAYRHAKGEGGEATLFRIPFDCENVPGVNVLGSASLKIHPDEPVCVNFTGVQYFAVSKKGKAVADECCFAGLKDMKLIDAEGHELFSLNENIADVLSGEKSFEIKGAVEMRFTRREISFVDMVKGRLSKPLDSMKDMVIVRSDGTPVFHIANVCDDVLQNITHIIRGDDHVENSYRHIFLFNALDYEVPKYGHLPMIVNKQGKPYSKRDGDAFIGDFRTKGFLGETLFNYLVLLGWNPGDDREVLSAEEMVREFDIEKVQNSPAQMDMKKLEWMNGEYLHALPPEIFMAGCQADLEANGVIVEDEAYLKQVLDLVSERIKLFTEVTEQTKFFFSDSFEIDEKAVQKRVQKEGVKETLETVRGILAGLESFTAESTDAALHKFVEESGLGFGQVMPPIRLAVSGQGSGPDLFPLLGVLGRERVLARIDQALSAFFVNL